MSKISFSGEWLSEYSYQPDDQAEPLTSSHLVVARDDGHNITVSSLLQDDGSELNLTLGYDEESKTLTGVWTETTSRAGRYRGMIFHGALQLLLNREGNVAAGKWVGFNSSRTKIKTGDWSLRKKS